MSHFPQHTPAQWEFTRGESDGHRAWRQAVDRSQADAELSRQQGSGSWWQDQRYLNQALPSQFTDPKTFDNFNYGYQMYARQPVQRQIQSLAEASDAIPPVRYNVKRIAVDRPYKNAVCAMRCCSNGFYDNNHNQVLSSNRIELPPIGKDGSKRNGCDRSRGVAKSNPVENAVETSSSVCSASVMESVSNLGGDYTNSSNNSSNNNNNSNNNKNTKSTTDSNTNNNNNNNNNKNTKSTTTTTTNNNSNNNNNNNTNNNNAEDFTHTHLNFNGSGTIQNVFYPCASYCPKTRKQGTESGNNNTTTNKPTGSDCTTRMSQYSPGQQNHTQHTNLTEYRPKRNEMVLKAYPLHERRDDKAIPNCPRQQEISSFVCRPSDANMAFPRDKWVEGRRIDQNVEENDREVVCHRIYRCTKENTQENAHLDSIDPLIVCQVKSKKPGFKPKPGYGTYKIIGGKQYREPQPDNIVDEMTLPPHLQKFKEYQRRCPDVRRGRYDKSNSLYQMLLPSDVCSTVISADLNPFRYARNTNRNNTPPPAAKAPDCYSCVESGF